MLNTILDRVVPFLSIALFGLLSFYVAVGFFLPEREERLYRNPVAWWGATSVPRTP